MQLGNRISRHPKTGSWYQCPQIRTRPRKTVTQQNILQTTPNSPVMPCQLNCEVHRLNLELQVIKRDKIRTLTELYQVTKDLGQDDRRIRSELPRIERKLMTTIAERLYIEDEISRGCPACRQTWLPRNKTAPQMIEPKNPQTAVPSSKDKLQWECNKVWRTWH